MIVFDDVTITHADSAAPTLRAVSLRVEEGELAVVFGRTGAGKSTLLGAVNGLVPQFTGGRLEGRVSVAGRNVSASRPRDLAEVVGVVGQDPLAGFVTDTVEEELAYGMEQLAVPPHLMRKRVEEVLDLLGIADLRARPLRTLSGGQQQRVAIGSVLTTQPRVLVLDEPTSALDPTAAEDVLATMTRLVHDLGFTVLVAEHRLERVLQYADRLVHLPGDGRLVHGAPAQVMEHADLAPPVVRLGRLCGWSPLPLSVRDARRRSSDLRALVAERPPPVPGPDPVASAPALAARGVLVRFGTTVAVRDVCLTLGGGEIVALMGRNGSGKSSLLWALQGAGPRQAGAVRVSGRDPSRLPAREARRLVGLVPQTASDLLFLETVDAECAAADAECGAAPGGCRSLLADLLPGIDPGLHPRDLSEGQRLALVVAIQTLPAPPVLLLDEPTRGLDYHAKERLVGILTGLAAAGRAVVVATHDVEFAAAVAGRVVVMAGGEVVADGATREIVSASAAFAPQVAKILAPLPLLTVDEVAALLPSPVLGRDR